MIKNWILLMWGTLFSFAWAKQGVVYVGSYTAENSAGINVYSLDLKTGRMNILQTVDGLKNPSFLTVDARQRRLYAVFETNDYLGANQGAVGAFAIDQRKWTLSLLNQQPSQGAHPCHLAVDPQGELVAVANYSGGNIILAPISHDGSLLPATFLAQHSGSGPNQSRQQEAHAHSVTFSPEGSFLLAADLGIDKIMSYLVDRENKQLVPSDPPFTATAPGAGPRHLTFSADGKYVYVINELNSTISAYHYHAQSGALSEFQTVSSLPLEFKGSNTCADIHITPNGQFLYGSNRGHDSLAIFKINRQSGELTPLGHSSCGGKTPRNFAVDPSGKFLLAANQNSNNVVVFRINRRDGSLNAVHEINVSMPVCVKIINP